MALWGGRFSQAADQRFKQFNDSLRFDYRLAEQDITGSVAWSKALVTVNVLTQAEQQQLEAALNELLADVRANPSQILESDAEDIHSWVEGKLIDKVGALGKKLHTGRSRNDQVATDLKLWCKEQVALLLDATRQLQRALVTTAEANQDAVMPGYTHLQRAQPILFAHHLLAYVSMFQRDAERLMDSYKRINILPLGAGALAGTTFPIDRHFVAEQLGFDGVYENSLDAVSDRDFILEFLSGASILMMHMSRLCEELVLWSSTEFGFVELDDAFCTGSSIMPQKKNPDVAELVRGKTGRVYGNLMGLLTVLKSLPLAYNKDMQEDKEGMFDTVATLDGALRLFAPMIATMKVRTGRMREAVNKDFSNATDIADFLVGKGLPFRQAHEVIGKTVLHCIENGKYLLDLSLEEFKGFSDLFDEDIYDVLQPENVVNARNVYGGTAAPQVEAAIVRAETTLELTTEWLNGRA